MPRIHVCPLSKLDETVTTSGASHVVTLINANTQVVRPAGIDAERYLFIGVSDIVDPLDGHIVPAQAHVSSLLGFARAWDRQAPLLIHCWAGVSRSTAAAFISACALVPHREEMDFALALRKAAPSATPNKRLVTVADDMLGRRGRMIEAIETIGRGADCFEGTPFSLALE